MPEPLRILAGDCTVTDEDGDETRQERGNADETRRERGNVVTLCKPDNCGELLVDWLPPKLEGRCTIAVWTDLPDSWDFGRAEHRARIRQ